MAEKWRAEKWGCSSVLKAVRENRRLADYSRLLPPNCSAIDPNRTSLRWATKVALFSAARQSAKLGTDSFIALRRFACGCDTVRIVLTLTFLCKNTPRQALKEC